MNKSALSALTLFALADPAPAELAGAPASPHTFSDNLALASDNRFRGISQTFKSSGAFNHTDYKIGVSRDFGWANVGQAVIGTNAGGKAKDISSTAGVLSNSKTL